MAYINIDNKIVSNFNSENLEVMLNDIIDNELNKDESQVNTALINDCVDALIMLSQQESNKFNALVPLMSSNAFLDVIIQKANLNKSAWKSLNKFARATIIAAVIAGTTITANAAVEAVTGVNVIKNISDAIQERLGIVPYDGIDIIQGEDEDDETTTVETTTVKPTETTTIETTTQLTTTTTKPSTTKHEGIDVIQGEDEDDETTTKAPTTEATTEVSTTEPSTTEQTTQETTTEVTTEATTEATTEKEKASFDHLRAEFDGFKTDYIYGEKLSYDGLRLFAVYTDNTEKEISLNECSYTKAVDLNVTADYTLRVIYKTCVLEINITCRPDEETRGAEVCSNDEFDYLVTQKGVYLSKYKGNSTSVNIDTIDGKEVVQISASAFAESDVEYISAQNVERILQNAFKNCKSLVDCYTPMAKYIGESAFENCNKLSDAVFSNNANYFGKKAYKNTGVENVTLSSSISTVPASLFENCQNLKTVTLNGKPKVIEASAFSNCTALKKLNGAGEIKNVESFAFFNDENVEFDVVPQLINVGEGAFEFCKSIDFGAQNNIKTIGEQSFLYCTKLTKIKLSDGITELPYGCLRGAHITEFEIPSTVTKIGDYALMSTAIKEISIPSSVKEIGTYAIYATTLRNVYFESDDVKIDSQAFYNGSRLKFYVHNDSSAMSFAIENDINYSIY